MHFCTAAIAIAGDDQQKVFRNRFNPISWPEIEVLLALHGDGSITNIVPFVDVEQDVRSERDRLDRIYGENVVSKGDTDHAAVYPGRNPNLHMTAPECVRAVGQHWKNPISERVELITAEGSEVVPNTPLVRDSRNVELPQMVFGDPRPSETPSKSTKGKSAKLYDDTSEHPFGAGS